MQKRNDWLTTTIFSAALVVACGNAHASTDTTNYLLADFETSLGTTPWYGYWFHFTDVGSKSAADTALMGNSTITSLDSMGYPFYDDSGYYDRKTYPLGRSGEPDSHSSRMAFALGDRPLSCAPPAGCSYAPYVGWAMIFTTQHGSNPNDTIDLTGAAAISFWAKSDTDTVTVNFSLIIRDSNNLPDYSMAIKVGPQWTKYNISLNPATLLLKQPEWATKKPFDLRHVAGMGFGFNRADNGKLPTNGMSIDDILIENWKYDDPNLVDAIRPSTRMSRSRAGYRLLIQGSQIRLIRADGERVTPFNLNGRGLPAR